MDVNSMAILILLGSFFLMIMLRFPIAYAVALSSCILSDGPGAASDYHLSADGKRYQLFQLNGSTFLYHNGMPDGFRWYF